MDKSHIDEFFRKVSKKSDINNSLKNSGNRKINSVLHTGNRLGRKPGLGMGFSSAIVIATDLLSPTQA